MDKYLKIILAAGCIALAASCEKTQEPAPAASRLVPVQVSLSGAGEDAPTRYPRNAALKPEEENWIWDYYYIQFNSKGIALVSGHRRADVEAGDMVVSDEIDLYNESGSTVVFIANISPKGASYGDDPLWKSPDGVVSITDNLPSFQKMKFDMSKRIVAALNGTLRHMPMSGYWTGDVDGSSDFRISVSMGRMVSRINLNFMNASDRVLSKVTLRNVSKKAYLFPQVTNAPLGAGDYMQIVYNVDGSNQDVNIKPNQSRTLVFYSAPNFCVGSDRATDLVVKMGGSSGQLLSPLKLGDDPADGDYNLYQNTTYNFNITVTL